MKRLFAYAAAAVTGCALFLSAQQNARASVFCPVQVSFFQPWNTAADGPAAGPSRTFGFGLSGNDAGRVSGHMVFLTHEKAYRVEFKDVQLSPGHDDPSEIQSSVLFTALPAKSQVEYAWIDDATDADGKTFACPTDPFAIEPLEESVRLAMTAPAPVAKANRYVVYDSLPATEMQTLSTPACGTAYAQPGPAEAIPHDTDYFDSSIGRGTATTETRVDIDSSGHVVNVAVLHSSGSVTIDVAAKNALASIRWNARVFRCEKVVSHVYYSMSYSLGR